MLRSHFLGKTDIKYYKYTLIHVLFHRELHEESGLRADKLDEVGRIMFEFVGEPQLLEVHVFKGIEYSGVPVETEGWQSSLKYKCMY